MKELYKQVEQLTNNELSGANEKFPMFHSTHEAYAVLKEEIEELECEIEEIKILLSEIWQQIRLNQNNKEIIQQLKRRALFSACKAIQVSAMAQKMIDSEVNYK